MKDRSFAGVAAVALVAGLAAAPAVAQQAAPASRPFEVYFEFDRSTLTPDARQVVQAAAQNALQGNATHIVATGHTDTVGSNSYNLALSQRRADAVTAELVHDGVARNQITTNGVGVNDLAVPTAQGVNEPRNRRVEVTVQLPPAPAAPAPAEAPAAAAAPPHPTWNGIMFSGHVEAGVNGNPNGPDNGVNFGQLFTDRANNFHMNQATLAAEHDIDSASADTNFGFRVEGMYGTDARYTHTFGLFDRATHSPYQWDLVEASGSAHLPFVFSGGIDLKGGLYPTPIGYEVIDANGNFFYTHSYIFNFGIPLKHTGLYTVSHVTDMIDLWAGYDTGVNAGLTRPMDNNATGAFLGGFAINNPIPNLTILALAHIGPENGYVKGASCATGATACYPFGHVNGHARQIYDAVTTYKLNDQITLANEINFIKDDLFHASAEGTAFYGIYKWTDEWSFGARAEVFRDDQGFFVGAFQGSQAFVNVERGIGMGNTIGPVNANNGVYNNGKQTYFELTLGANYSPALNLPYNLGLTVRPEFRWDHSWGGVNGSSPFIVTNASGRTTPVAGNLQGTKNDQFLLSVDAIFGF